MSNSESTHANAQGMSSGMMVSVSGALDPLLDISDDEVMCGVKT